MERTLEANAATIALIGLGLGALFSWWFFLIPAVVATFLLQHALQGWCSPLPILRRLHFRTAREIENERVALKVAPPEDVQPLQARRKELGYKRVYNLGGFSDAMKAGMPTEC